MKKFGVILSVALAIICSLTMFACGAKAEIVKFEAPESVDVSYGSTYTLPTVVAEDNVGNKLLAEATVAYSDGSAVSSVGGKVYIDKMGYYVVTYKVTYEDGKEKKSASKSCKLIVKNDEIPVINVDQDFYFVYTNEKFVLPTATATDAVGKDLPISYAVRYLKADGAKEDKTIVTESGVNSFTPDVNGDYELVITAQNEGGKNGERIVSIESAKDENKVIYTDYRGGSAFIEKNENVAIGYSSDVKFGAEKGSLQITDQAHLADGDGNVWMDMKFVNSAIQNVAPYNFVYFYIYNGGNTSLTMNLNNVFGENVVLYPSEWNMALIKKADFAKIIKNSAEADAEPIYSMNKFQLLINVKGIDSVKLNLSSVCVADVMPSIDFSLMPDQVIPGENNVDLSKITAKDVDNTAINSIALKILDSENKQITIPENATNKISLNELGVYSIVASASGADGKMICASKTMEVVADKYIMKMSKQLTLGSTITNNDGNTTLLMNDNATYVYAGEENSLRVNITDGCGSPYLVYSVKTTQTDLTKFDGIYFYVWNMWREVPFYIKGEGTKGDIQVTTILKNHWNRIEIRKADYEKYFTDPTNVSEIKFIITDNQMVYSNSYYMSSIMGMASGSAAIDTSAILPKYAVDSKIKFDSITCSATGKPSLEYSVTVTSPSKVETQISYADRANDFTLSEAGNYVVTVNVRDGDIVTNKEIRVFSIPRQEVNDKYIIQMTQDLKFSFGDYVIAGNGTTVEAYNNQDCWYGDDKLSVKIHLTAYAGGEAYPQFNIKTVNKNINKYDKIYFYLKAPWLSENARIHVKDKTGSAQMLGTVTKADGWKRFEIRKDQYASFFAEPANVSQIEFLFAQPGGDNNQNFYMSSIFAETREALSPITAQTVIADVIGVDGGKTTAGLETGNASYIPAGEANSVKIQASLSGATNITGFSYKFAAKDMTSYESVYFNILNSQYGSGTHTVNAIDKDGNKIALAVMAAGDNKWYRIELKAAQFDAMFTDKTAVSEVKFEIADSATDARALQYFIGSFYGVKK